MARHGSVISFMLDPLRNKLLTLNAGPTPPCPSSSSGDQPIREGGNDAARLMQRVRQIERVETRT